MTKRRVTNVAASVRQQLQNHARTTGRPFQVVLQYFAMERFLYRLSQSPHADRFVLKGALMFNVWRTPTSRPTKDIDLLGRIDNNPSVLEITIRDVCRQVVEDDGLVFDPGTVAASIIKEDADYEGVRVSFRGTLENARVVMQIDVGFGDVVSPGPEVTVYPTILDHPKPTLRGYPRETVVAEKFEAMVKLGQLNSRMKDFYDMRVLSHQFDFDGPRLMTAIEKTFAHRGTPVETQPVAFSPAFAADAAKGKQWQAFLRKSQLTDAPAEFAAVIDSVAKFLAAPAEAVIGRRAFPHVWHAPGPWVAS